MGLRALNNLKAAFEDPYASTGLDAVNAAPTPPAPNPWTATGGTQAVDSGYMFHYFTSPGPNPFVVSNDPIPEASFILVAGGGSGCGGYGSGGGGGGVVYSNAGYEIATGTWTVTIGDGGPAPSGTDNLTVRRGVSGSDSTFVLPTGPVTITAKGGGGGRWTPDTSPHVPSTPPAGGSSGGGAGTPNTVQTATQPTQNPGISGITNAGNAGGNAAGWPGPGGGGGGGAGGVGTAGPPTQAGTGGPGLGPPTWSWLPTSYFHNGYAAGGGGGSSYYGSGGSSPGAAPPDGTGGGGGSVNSNGGAGQTNSGGGGAGANQPGPGTPAYQNQGGAGGSGAMVIAYPFSGMYASGGTTVTSGDYTYHVYTTDSTFVVSGSPANIEALIIGGGGGTRADWPGGGGAGGVAHAQNWPITPGTYPVVVGDGGEATAFPSGDGSASQGESSTFDGITALGGGAGVQDAYQGPHPFNPTYMSGGSGGGNGDEPVGPTTKAGLGLQPTQPNHSGLVTNYGNPGYAPAGGNTWPAASQDNGGGGGAGSGGTDGLTTGGVGGNGAPFSNFPGPVLAPAIPSTPTWASVVGPTGVFAGGGGGSYQASGSRAGGPGGGGTSGPSGSDGLNYTGGGGGGKSGSPTGGYEGGKGIVIIRYLTG